MTTVHPNYLNKVKVSLPRGIATGTVWLHVSQDCNTCTISVPSLVGNLDNTTASEHKQKLEQNLRQDNEALESDNVEFHLSTVGTLKGVVVADHNLTFSTENIDEGIKKSAKMVTSYITAKEEYKSNTGEGVLVVTEQQKEVMKMLKDSLIDSLDDVVVSEE